MKDFLKIITAALLLIIVSWIFENSLKDPAKKVDLDIPFLCQAPHANWDQPWQDACEEAGIIMAMHYVNNKLLDKGSGNQEILDLVQFQKNKYGGHHDLTAKQIAKLIKDYYQHDKVEVRYDITFEDIRNELAKGNPVIAPMAGRMLNNPYYTPPGPAYHCMVFKGYDDLKEEFITNDMGTRRGENYRYKYEVAFNAIHDWPGSKETISSGRKAIIVVHPHTKRLRLSPGFGVGVNK